MVRGEFLELINFAKNGNSKELKKQIKLMNEDELTRIRDRSGGTLLHVACERGVKETSKVLIKKAGKRIINTADNNGLSPLQIAIKNQHLSLAQFLLQQDGISVNSTNDGTPSLLMVAALPFTPETKTLMEALLAKGACVNCVNKYKETALHQAALQPDGKMAQFLIDYKIGLNHQNLYGETALHKAVRVFNLKVTQLLLDRGIYTSAAGEQGTAREVFWKMKSDGVPEEHASVATEISELLEKAQLIAKSPSGSRVLTPDSKQMSMAARGKFCDPFQRVDMLLQSINASNSGGTKQNLDNTSLLLERINSLSILPEKEVDEDDDEDESKRKKEEDTTTEEDLSASTGSRLGVTKGSRKDSFSVLNNTPVIDYDEKTKYYTEDGGRGDPKTPYDVTLVVARDYYKEHFYGKPHTNLIGSHETAEGNSCIFSILDTPSNNSFHGLLLTSKGYEEIFVPISLTTSGNNIDTVISFLEKRKQTSRYKFYPVNEPGFDTHLLTLEEMDPERTRCFTIGVLYAKGGQRTEEEMYDNEHGSEGFNDFLTILGDKINLLGWSGYTGKMKNKDSKSLYTHWNGFEIMFHVSTFLPYDKLDPLKTARWGYMRNDLVMIVFLEDGVFPTSAIRSIVNHVFLIVQPVTNENGDVDYKIGVVSRNTVPPFGPHLPSPPVFKSKEALRTFILTKLTNGLFAAQKSTSFDVAFRHPRKVYIHELALKFPEKRRRTNSGILRDFFRK